MHVSKDMFFNNVSNMLNFDFKWISLQSLLSSQNCHLKIKSTYQSQAVESASLESDEEKSIDGSESIRFIPPKSKSGSAKKVSNKDDQAKHQHQNVSNYTQRPSIL